jgi:hypothetical protein
MVVPHPVSNAHTESTMYGTKALAALGAVGVEDCWPVGTRIGRENRNEVGGQTADWSVVGCGREFASYTRKTERVILDVTVGHR